MLLWPEQDKTEIIRLKTNKKPPKATQCYFRIKAHVAELRLLTSKDMDFSQGILQSCRGEVTLFAFFLVELLLGFLRHGKSKFLQENMEISQR